MKTSNLLIRFWKLVTDGTSRQHLTIIYLCSLMATCLLCLFFAPCPTGDTPTYITAADVIMSGGVDAFRTPVYPLLLRFSSVVIPQSPYIVIIALQLIAFYCSILYLYKLCGIVIESRALRFLVTLLYSCAPNFIVWTMGIMTESLAVSALIVFCYSVLQGRKTGELKYAVANFALLVLLVFMRPIFVFLVPIVLLLWVCEVVISGRFSSYSISTFISLLVFCVIYVSYGKLLEKRCGVFTLSMVGSINQYDILRNNDIADVSLVPDDNMRAELVALMAKNDSVRRGGWHLEEKELLIGKYGIADFDAYVKENIRTHSSQYVKCCAKKFVSVTNMSAMGVPVFTCKSYTIARTIFGFCTIFMFSFGLVYILLLLVAILFVTQGWRQRRLPVASALLWLIAVANVFTAVVGAPSEYARLILPSKPLLMILAAMLLDAVTVKIRKDYRVL